jgi:hypothetical protein
MRFLKIFMLAVGVALLLTACASNKKLIIKHTCQDLDVPDLAECQEFKH